MLMVAAQFCGGQLPGGSRVGDGKLEQELGLADPTPNDTAEFAICFVGGGDRGVLVVEAANDNKLSGRRPLPPEPIWSHGLHGLVFGILPALTLAAALLWLKSW